MANPTSILSGAGHILICTTSDQAIIIPNSGHYRIGHLGLDASGATDKGIVAVSINAATPATLAAAMAGSTNCFLLVAGESLSLGPWNNNRDSNQITLYFKSFTGAPGLQLMKLVGGL
jgi:hypothetical protein